MAINWVLPVRALQAVLSIVVLGLMAYVSSWWSSHWRQVSPAEVNWMIFAPVWTILALVALIVVPWKMPHIANAQLPKIGLLVLEGLTMVHWLAGFLALAVFLSDRICFGTVCQVAKAGTAIAAFQWVAWAVTLVVSGMRVFGRGRAAAAPMLKEPKVEMHQGV
ncbi:hypothetical protein K505DRAFT_365478 [Melanomma pulvis-pyrius CBS 109.77]|uniref:MARVEL domain-containing protein n=1 Tax=Melanomma pulvis-pyrius CBS 109.77 TaxID=1314802 RepID=A0A6A6X110_9PLEO|nr:hypothetical protein K505DRAFT_365478 [Melanomma pulvis-pyrius CBS 109.77]